MELQLYLWSGARALFLERHNFFVEQLHARVLAQFSDIEGDANRFMASEFDRLRKILDDGSRDEGDVADMALSQGTGFYSLLSDMKEAMILGGLASLYHEWEKELRNFIEGELRHYTGSETAIKLAWSRDISNSFDILKEFGWDVRSEAFFADLDAFRLIVNVYKHGKGGSLKDLGSKYPEFLDVPPVFFGDASDPERLDYEWLKVSAVQFDRLAGSIRDFWTAFPERAFAVI